MSDLELIQKALEKAAARRRVDRALRGFCQGLLVGAGIVVLAVAVYKLAPLPHWTLLAAWACGLVSPLIGLVIGGWRRNTVREMARWVDGREHLQERISTALEMAGGSAAETWRELIVTDAAAHAKDLDPRKLVKFRLTQAARWGFALLLLAIGLGFVPEYRSKAFAQKQAEAKIIKEAGHQLTELTKRSLTNVPPALPATQKAMESVAELGNELTKKAMTRDEALKAIEKVTDRIKDELNERGPDPAMKRLEQAARTPGGENSPDAARLQKQIAETQKQLGTPTGTPEEMDKLNKELQKAQDAAKAATDKDGKMSQSDREKLSKSLAALSKQAQEMGIQMPNLDQAIEALKANQTDMLLKDLQQATLDLEKTKEMAKSLQQMQQQMERIGKDLAEQLKNGQADEARNTLQKMIDKLRSANLTPEQLQKMTAEVAAAVDPASKYGSVADHLSKAAASLKDGQKADAVAALAAAQKEIDKMAQDAGDAEGLSAELAALNQASMSVGTGQSWGQCKSSGPPNAGKGGKPGKGVGTWADENSGWGFDSTMTDHWDNSGVVRPDTDPKGKTDRGPGELNDALKPTKVKGQFSPGGQMPSITLKGVSIKGQSKVVFEEAAVAAQADAQSALSQEKVPRAYQSSVKDYFDDLKK